MDPKDAQHVIKAFQEYLDGTADSILPSGLFITCMDHRLNNFPNNAKMERSGGGVVDKFTDSLGNNGALTRDLHILFNGKKLEEIGDFPVTVAGHSDCLAMRDFYNELVHNEIKDIPKETILRIPEELQENLKKAVGHGASEDELIHATAKVMALQNMKNFLEYAVPEGVDMKTLLGKDKLHPIVAMINIAKNYSPKSTAREKFTVEVYDWDEQKYRAIEEIAKDAKKAPPRKPARPKEFRMKKGSSSTVASFYENELSHAIKVAVEDIGKKSSLGALFV